MLYWVGVVIGAVAGIVVVMLIVFWITDKPEPPNDDWKDGYNV